MSARWPGITKQLLCHSERSEETPQKLFDHTSDNAQSFIVRDHFLTQVPEGYDCEVPRRLRDSG